MAEGTPLFMDINNAYSGDELGLPYRDLIAEGVVDLAGGDLEVTATSPASMSVDVAAGAAWVTGDTNPDLQPTYRVRNDGVVNKGIAADPSNPRKVLVVAQIEDQAFAGDERKWTIEVIHGIPAGSPTVPALPASALPLAEVHVGAGATSIASGDITDLRTAAALALGVEDTGTEIVTALPGSPVEGQEIFLVDSLTAPTRLWHLKYFGALAGTSKWWVISATPLFAEVLTSENTTSTTYTALATAGPSIALPLAGDYDVEVSARLGTGAQRDGLMSYDIGATAAVDNDAAFDLNGRSAVSAVRRKTGLTAVTLTAKYRTSDSGFAVTASHRRMKVTPIRVG